MTLFSTKPQVSQLFNLDSAWLCHGNHITSALKDRPLMIVGAEIFHLIFFWGHSWSKKFPIVWPVKYFLGQTSPLVVFLIIVVILIFSWTSSGQRFFSWTSSGQNPFCMDIAGKKIFSNFQLARPLFSKRKTNTWWNLIRHKILLVNVHDTYLAK